MKYLFIISIFSVFIFITGCQKKDDMTLSSHQSPDSIKVVVIIKPDNLPPIQAQQALVKLTKNIPSPAAVIWIRKLDSLLSKNQDSWRKVIFVSRLDTAVTVVERLFNESGWQQATVRNLYYFAYKQPAGEDLDTLWTLIDRKIIQGSVNFTNLSSVH